MFVNSAEDYTVDDANPQLQFYRADDSAYLVVNVFIGENGVLEFVFLPDKDKDKQRTAILVFDFLKEVNFSLHQLLLWPNNAAYVVSEMGEEIVVGGLKITCEFNHC